MREPASSFQVWGPRCGCPPWLPVAESDGRRAWQKIARCDWSCAIAAAAHPPAPPPARSPVQYGWRGSIEDLDDDAAEVLQDAYSSDPTWAAQGPALLRQPRLAGGRLLVELSSFKEAPKAVENFRCLCTGERGTGKASGKALHYKGVRMHRAVASFLVQGGDVVKVSWPAGRWCGWGEGVALPALVGSVWARDIHSILLCCRGMAAEGTASTAARWVAPLLPRLPSSSTGWLRCSTALRQQQPHGRASAVQG